LTSPSPTERSGVSRISTTPCKAPGANIHAVSRHATPTSGRTRTPSPGAAGNRASPPAAAGFRRPLLHCFTCPRTSDHGKRLRGHGCLSKTDGSDSSGAKCISFSSSFTWECGIAAWVAAQAHAARRAWTGRRSWVEWRRERSLFSFFLFCVWVLWEAPPMVCALGGGADQSRGKHVSSPPVFHRKCA